MMHDFHSEWRNFRRGDDAFDIFVVFEALQSFELIMK